MKKHFIFLTCLTFLAIEFVTCQTTNKQWDNPYFFLLMSDPQFGLYNKNQSFEKETELFEKAIIVTNKLKPAFVIVCRDLIHLPGNKAQIAEFLRIIDKLDKSIPYYLVAGNHDIKDFPTTQSIEKYKNEFGEDRYLFIYQGCQFIVLNSNIIHKPDSSGREIEKQLNWLENQLKSSKKYHYTFIIQHHSIFLENVNEPDGYFTITKDRRKPYLDLFQKYNVKVVFSGHYHQSNYIKYGTMDLITAGSVGMPLGKDPSGFTIVKVFKDSLDHKYYGFDEMPEKISVEP